MFTDKLIGNISVINVEENVYVVNMIAQHDIRQKMLNGKWTKPIRYDALSECIRRVSQFIKVDLADKHVSVHMPRIGCGLAGGNWTEVEKIIIAELKESIVVYDLPK